MIVTRRATEFCSMAAVRWRPGCIQTVPETYPVLGRHWGGGGLKRPDRTGRLWSSETGNWKQEQPNLLAEKTLWFCSSHRIVQCSECVSQRIPVNTANWTVHIAKCTLQTSHYKLHTAHRALHIILLYFVPVRLQKGGREDSRGEGWLVGETILLGRGSFIKDYLKYLKPQAPTQASLKGRDSRGRKKREGGIEEVLGKNEDGNDSGAKFNNKIRIGWNRGGSTRKN